MKVIQRVSLGTDQGGRLHWDPFVKGVWITSYEGAALHLVVSKR